MYVCGCVGVWVCGCVGVGGLGVFTYVAKMNDEDNGCIQSCCERDVSSKYVVVFHVHVCLCI